MSIARTLHDLDAAVKLADEAGAVEFLLLPEKPVRGFGGIDALTTDALQRWVAQYCGRVPLTISEANAEGFPTCNPLVEETGLRAYAHIDASGVLKTSSYNSKGVSIGTDGVIQALATLQTHQEQSR